MDKTARIIFICLSVAIAAAAGYCWQAGKNGDKGMRHLVILHVNDTHESFTILTEIIQERRILAERMVSVAGIVGRRIIVAEEDNHTALHKLFEFSTTTDISFFAIHRQ